MKITGICVTYNRPKFLGRAIHCFEQQDNVDARLLILDDAGQYVDQDGPGWNLISKRDRYVTLGEKRNAAVKLACEIFPQTEGFAVWDDDDVYWPYAISAVAAALDKGDWVQPSVVYEPTSRNELTELKRTRTYNGNARQFAAYGGSWGWRMDVFNALGGYPAIDNSEDQALAEEAIDGFGLSLDVISPEYPEPHYMYHRRELGAHMSDVPTPYAVRGQCDIVRCGRIPIGWNGPNCYELPIKPGVELRGW